MSACVNRSKTREKGYKRLAQLKIIRKFSRFNSRNCNKNWRKGQSWLNRIGEINFIIIMARLTITHTTAAIWASTIFLEDQVHQKLEARVGLKTETRKNGPIDIEYPKRTSNLWRELRQSDYWCFYCNWIHQRNNWLPVGNMKLL